MLTKRISFSLCVLITALLMAGCGESDDHSGHSHDGEVNSQGNANAHEKHGSGHADKLGPVTIEGRHVTVTLFADLKPGATVHGDIKVTGDPVDAVRGWVGDESGEGSLKAKAGGSGGSYHIDLEAPGKLGDDAKVWIELEINGERHVQGLKLPNH